MTLRRFVLLLSLPLTLAACAAPAPKPTATTASAWPDLRAEYRALAAKGVVYAVDPAASKLRIYVFRGGKAAKLGHNHVLTAPRFEGYVSVPDDNAANATFELRVPLADLVVDNTDARNDTGGNFAGERSASDIAGTRTNMLGPHGLDEQRDPVVRLRSVAIEGDWPILVAQVEITLHGVTRTQDVMLRVQRDAQRLTVSGTLLLRQSDFGVAPFSVFGGLLAVQDPVAIAFDLTATRIN